MTAKEMFEALGYEEDHHFAYVKFYNEKEDLYIWFSQPEETIEANFDITMPLLKAINQQCKELGWLDE